MGEAVRDVARWGEWHSLNPFRMISADSSRDPSPGERPETRELSALLVLALPLAAANLGQVLIGFVDVAVLGRMGPLALGAGGLGNSLYFTFAVFGMGLMLGLDPLLSQAAGAGDVRRSRRWLWQGLWLALAVAIPLATVAHASGGLLERAGIAERSAVLTREYLFARLPGLLPYLLFVGARSYLQAKGSTKPILVGVVLANLFNLPASWILAMGDSGLDALGLSPVGFEGLGVAGTAWASSVSTAIQLLVLARAVRDSSSGTMVPQPPEVRLMWKALRLGAPIGAAMLAEYGVFALVNVLMGNLDAMALAGHQVALAFAGTTFVIPVGIGAAAAVRVGRAVGRGDASGTRRAGVVGIAAGGGFMLAAALVFWTVPAELAVVVTDNPHVVVTAVPLLLIAALFQLSDGVQAVAAGALRGAGDTQWPLWLNLAGHYLIGLPVGVALAFGFGCGAAGLWWGLSVGLTTVAVGLTARFWRLSARPVARV